MTQQCSRIPSNANTANTTVKTANHALTSILTIINTPLRMLKQKKRSPAGQKLVVEGTPFTELRPPLPVRHLMAK
jgi:hypothetical protein